MFRSLRFRLPALFLAGIALRAPDRVRRVRGSSRTTRDEQALAGAAAQAAGLAALYGSRRSRRGRSRTPARAAREGHGRPDLLRRPVALPGTGLRLLAAAANIVDVRTRLPAGRAQTFEFAPPGDDGATSRSPRRSRRTRAVGRVAVAKPRAELAALGRLLERLLFGLIGGLLVAAGSPATSRAGSRAHARAARAADRSRRAATTSSSPTLRPRRDRAPSRALPRDGRIACRGRGARAALPHVASRTSCARR